MAKVNLANIPPDAWPRVRGSFLAKAGIYGPYAAKWPRKRGKPTNPAVIFTSKQFGIAARMAANSEPVQFETAREMTKGTDWLPRDLLTLAAYGKAYEVFAPDGTPFTQADHGYPSSAQPERTPVTNWQPNRLNDITALAFNTVATCYKGTAFIPRAAMTLYSTMTYIDAAAGQQYQACAAEIDAAGLISAVTFGDPVDIADTGPRFYEIPLPATLAAGNRYAILIGRIDATPATPIRLTYSNQAAFLIPASAQQFARIASLTPAIGETVTLGTASYVTSLLLEF